MVNKRYDLAIIGGGIVGLALAMELCMCYPALHIGVLEKEKQIALHQTGHNSGVIHSGIYYTPGSLKARACIMGRKKLIRFCDAHNIPYAIRGKVIVATQEEELPSLEQLYKRGLANGVPQLEMIGPERLRELEPYAIGMKALYVPSTGIVDYAQVARAYANEVTNHGGDILIHHEVHSIKRQQGYHQLFTVSDCVEARYIISCAGLHSDHVAQMSNIDSTAKIVPFRGDYYILRPEKNMMVHSMIYPVPDPRFPFLGVHFTRRINDEIWLGPNATLAFAREGYRRLGINPREFWETVRFRGFQKLARTYWKMGLDEMYRDFSKRAFLHSLQRYMPDLQLSDLLPGPAGVRAQALDDNGTLVDDFVVQQQEGALHVLNAPSPAATSSLAIAEIIVQMAQKAFSLH